LTPQQIQNKYALPSTSKYICDVEIPAGTNMRTGVANGVPDWGTGGGIQYDLMGEFGGVFSNERLLKIEEMQNE